MNEKPNARAIVNSAEGEIKIVCEYTTLLSPDGLIDHEFNTNTHTDKQEKVLYNSIKENGFINPLIVNQKDQKILTGHLRNKVAKQLGMEKVPVVFVNLEIQDQFKLINTDNELARMSKLDKVAFKNAQDTLKELLNKTDYQLSFMNPNHYGMFAWAIAKPEKSKKEPFIGLVEGDQWDIGGSRVSIEKFKSKNTADSFQKFLKRIKKLEGASPILLKSGDMIANVGTRLEDVLKLRQGVAEKSAKEKRAPKKSK